MTASVPPPRPLAPPDPSARRNPVRRGRLGAAGVYAGAAMLVLLVGFPFYWMVTTSLKTFREIAIDRTVVPRAVTGENYVALFEQTNMLGHALNTLLVSGLATLLTVAIASVAAYAMTRFVSGPGEWIARFSLYAYMVPSIVLIIPFYLALREAGLIDTRTGLVLSYLSFTLPLGIWMMRTCDPAPIEWTPMVG